MPETITLRTIVAAAAAGIAAFTHAADKALETPSAYRLLDSAVQPGLRP